MSTTGDASFNATIPEPVAKTCVGERTTPIVHKEREVAARCSIYDPLQRWQDRQGKRLGLAVASLELGKREFSALCVLLSEPDDVGATLSGEQEECQRKPRLRADRMTCLELLNVFERPRRESGRG